MKLSKFAKLVKGTGTCAVYNVEGYGIWLSDGHAIYRAPGLPYMEGREEVRTVLDIPQKAWDKIHLVESHCESIHDVAGLDLADYRKSEQDTEKLKVMAAPNGKWAVCRKCEDGELVFYQESLIAPVKDDLEKSEYITYTVRRTDSGTRYLVIRDGMDVLAAIMPTVLLDEEFLADLTDFQALCTEQFYRQRKADSDGEIIPEEQTEME